MDNPHSAYKTTKSKSNKSISRNAKERSKITNLCHYLWATTFSKYHL